jgi:hypothetical protein
VLPETTKPACPRVRVADLPTGHLKQKHIDHLEQNQQIASCCRHPENHDVEALKSHPDEQAPDIYIFIASAGRSTGSFASGCMTSDQFGMEAKWQPSPTPLFPAALAAGIPCWMFPTTAALRSGLSILRMKSASLVGIDDRTARYPGFADPESSHGGQNTGADGH